MKGKLVNKFSISVKFQGDTVSVSILNKDTGAIQLEVIPIIASGESLENQSTDQVKKDGTVDSKVEDSKDTESKEGKE